MAEQTISAALVIAILVSLVKPLIELWLPPTAPAHDSVIRLLAVAAGVGGEIIRTAVDSTITLQSAWSAAGTGLMEGVFAVATYHLVTANYFDSSTAKTPTPVP